MNSGIYKILNKVNGKFYIGSSKNIPHRKRKHFDDLNRNKHHSYVLQRAYNKYGKDNFVFVVLLYCEEFELLRYEQLLLDKLKPEYNIQPLASSSKGTQHTQEFKDRVSKSLMGRNKSNETRNKMKGHTNHAKIYNGLISPDGNLHVENTHLVHQP